MAPFTSLTDGQFRLMKIVGTIPIVQVWMEMFSMENAPEYFALSYSWGSEQDPETISLNECPFRVSRTVHSALGQLFSLSEIPGSYLWIDQICINQVDLQEKSRQVTSMNKIYASAKRVLIWLGPSMEDSELALGNMLDYIESVGANIPTDAAGREIADRCGPPKGDLLWTAWLKLFSRSWFQRVWILQEAVLANDALVICGPSTLDWETFVDFVTAILTMAPPQFVAAGFDPQGAFAKGVVNLYQIGDYQKRYKEHGSISFNELLACSRQRQCTNPMDHIYGIFAFLPQNLDSSFTVDYELEYEAAIVNFCREYIQIDPSYVLLDMAPSEYKSEGIPSWCPDLRSQSSELTFFSTYAAFSAGFTDREHRTSSIKPLRHSFHSNMITVRGFELDTVKATAQQSFSGLDFHSQTQEDLAWEEECRTLLQSVMPEPSAEAMQVYYRTLVAGHLEVMDNLLPTPVSPDQDLQAAYELFRGFLRKRATNPHDTALGEKFDDVDIALPYISSVNRAHRKKFFTTSEGRIGLGPSRVQAGDMICVLYSGAPLYVLRKKNANPNDGDGEDIELALNEVYEFIGDAYIEGLMNLSLSSSETRGPDRDFVLS